VNGFARILEDLNEAGVRYVLIGGIVAPICSLVDLVAMKRAVGRERDLADLADLEAAHGELPEPEG
jgi:predicted nucleotidyltransferase